MQQQAELNLEQTIAALRANQVVALPTETVYGLAGRISSEIALEKIFTTKKRPFFDPLIVHVQDLAHGEALAHWDPLSQALAQSFWPGPLTLVLPRQSDKVSNLITNGGETVALRSPAHPDFQKVLQGLGEALAAPSANLFGRTSPTSAKHVEEEFKGEVPYLDGGSCEVGIESTIVEVKHSDKTVTVLRPGLIDQEHLQEWLQNSRWSDYQVVTRHQENAPGFLKNHYQPQVPLLLIKGALNKKDESWREVLPATYSRLEFYLWTLPDDPSLAARYLYADLREANAPIYLYIQQNWLESPAWQGLLDRLQKASVAEVCKNQTWSFISKG